MSDADFWSHVFPQDRNVPEYDWTHEVEVSVLDGVEIAAPCPECGSFGACAYDAEGRALIHASADAADAVTQREDTP